MDLLDIVLGGKRGGGQGISGTAPEPVSLNDYGILAPTIEGMIGQGGGDAQVSADGAGMRSRIDPNNPPALTIRTQAINPGMIVTTYPTAVGVWEGKPQWLSAQFTMSGEGQATKVDVVLIFGQDEKIRTIVTVTPIAIPGA